MSVSWVGMSFSARDSRTAPQASGTATARPTASRQQHGDGVRQGLGQDGGRRGAAEADPAEEGGDRRHRERSVGVGMAELADLTGEQRQEEDDDPEGTDQQEDRCHRAPVVDAVVPGSLSVAARNGQGSPPARWNGDHEGVGMRREASILHLDLDAFFAAVEQRDKPSLRGRPGGRRRGRWPGRGRDGVLRGAGLRRPVGHVHRRGPPPLPGRDGVPRRPVRRLPRRRPTSSWRSCASSRRWWSRRRSTRPTSTSPPATGTTCRSRA